MGSDLTGRTVLVAGASSGMGQSTAVAAARAGARLILLSRNRAALEEVLAMLPGSKAAHRIAAVDAADAAALAAALPEELLAEIDIAVNSVGTNLVDRAFDRLTPDSWAGMMDANLTAAFNLARLLVPAFRAKGGGLLINIASTAARKPDRSGAAYQAAKAGVVALTHALTEEEWENGLRATAILPGMTDTPLLDKRPVPVGAEARAAALQPEDVAAACLFVMTLPPRAQVTELTIQPSRR
jgi:NADP-dependent 3-hydroxy acid dehydrogenase YdfG